MGRVGNRHVWQGGQTETRVGKRKNFFGASRRILPILAWNPAGAPGNRPRNKQISKHTNAHTNRQDRLQYTAPINLSRSVKMFATDGKVKGNTSHNKDEFYSRWSEADFSFFRVTNFVSGDWGPLGPVVTPLYQCVCLVYHCFVSLSIRFCHVYRLTVVCYVKSIGLFLIRMARVHNANVINAATGK